MAKVLPLLPKRATPPLAAGIGWAAYHLDGRGRAVALANLEAAFGGKYTPGQRRVIARRSYQNFARTMLDLFWAPRMTHGNFHRYLRVENAGVFEEIRARGESLIAVSTHAGNFEWANLVLGFVQFSATTISQAFKNPLVGGIFSGLRQVSGNVLIPQERSALRLMKHLARGGSAGMLVDLNLKPTEASTIIETFGLKMCVPTLHVALAQRSGARLVPLEGRPLPDGNVRMIVHPPLAFAPDATLQAMAQECWDIYERTLREQPHLWLWSYKHWRYKPEAAGARAYPFYANVSPHFEKLLKEVAAPAHRPPHAGRKSRARAQ